MAAHIKHVSFFVELFIICQLINSAKHNLYKALILIFYALFAFNALENNTSECQIEDFGEKVNNGKLQLALAVTEIT